MHPFHRILVPVDFTDASLAAVEYAAMIGRRFGAEVDLLHVWQPPYDVESRHDLLVEFAVSTAGRKMRACLAECELDGNVDAKGRIATGDRRDVPAAIIDVATFHEYDLIVMGTRGHAHLLKSSVFEKVVREAPCPVVTVREQEHEPAN